MKARPETPTTSTARPPSTSELARLLGDAHEAFGALIARGEAEGALSEWRKYTKNSPWVLKLTKGKRSLFYVRPDDGAIIVTVLLGPAAVKAALAGQVSKSLHPAIRKARPYPEGRPVNVNVRSTTDIDLVEQLIALKLKPVTAPLQERARRAGHEKRKRAARK